MAERGLPRPAPGPNRTHPRGRCRHNTRHPPREARDRRSIIRNVHLTCEDRHSPVCRTPPRIPKNRPPRRASGRGHQFCTRADRVRCDGIRGATRRQRAFARPFRSALNDKGCHSSTGTPVPDLATPTRPAAGTRRGRDNRHADHHDSEDPHGTPPGEGPRARLFAAEMALQPFALLAGPRPRVRSPPPAPPVGQGTWPSGANVQRSQPFELSNLPPEMAHARAIVRFQPHRRGEIPMPRRAIPAVAISTCNGRHAPSRRRCLACGDHLRLQFVKAAAPQRDLPFKYLPAERMACSQ